MPDLFHSALGDNTVLGRTGVGAQRQLETFPLPKASTSIRLLSDEVTSLCPITSQPDQYIVDVLLEDTQKGIESKSWKLFLQSFRDDGQFCEAFAATIAQYAHAATNARVTVVVTQKPRGGVTIVARAVVRSRRERLEEQCVIPGATDDYGNTTRNGKTVSWNRATWEDVNGAIPEGLHVLHHCDMKGCRNLEHLYLGTHQDNMVDRDERELQSPSSGPENGRAVLEVEVIEAIRAEYSLGGVTQAELGKRYGVTQSMVSNIVLYKNWKNF